MMQDPRAFEEASWTAINKHSKMHHRDTNSNSSNPFIPTPHVGKHIK